MSLETILVRVATIVAEEAARNPAFRAQLESAIGATSATSADAGGPPVEGDHPVPDKPDDQPPKLDVTDASGQPKGRAHDEAKSDGKRKGGRRPPAVLDPVELATQGEPTLRSKLSSLDLERLLDIVAQFGMDPGKLVMKWRDPDRVIDRIVELSLARATKGDAFRKE